MPYRIEIAAIGLEALRAISDRRTQAAIVRRIDALKEQPEVQGNSLRGDLAGVMSVRAAGPRYRVLFRIDEPGERVVVVFLGIRKQGSRQDVYMLAQRLVERG